MSTHSLSNALRNEIRGEADKQSSLSEVQRLALRTWSRRQRRAKAQRANVIAPSGALIWF